MSVVSNNILAGSSGQGGAAAYEIERSLRFNSADSASLSRTPSSAGNRKTWTWSGWVKRHKLGGNEKVFGSNTLWFDIFFGASDDLYLYWETSGTGSNYLYANGKYRDVSAWYHIVLSVDTTQSTASDRIKIYVNGSLLGWASASYPSQNYDTGINSTSVHDIGGRSGENVSYLNASLADVHFIDGQALAPTDFGETDTNGVWQPKEYTGSYGTNGFHLDFSDPSNLGNDAAGSNNWTPNNFFYLDAKTEVASAFTRTGTTHGPESNILDNNTSTSCGVQQGILTYTPSGTTTVSSQIKFWYSTGQSNTQFRVNGGSWNTLPLPSGVGTYTYTAFTGAVTSMEWRAPTSSELVSVHQIQIDTQILVNGSIAADIDSLIDTPTDIKTNSGNNPGNYATLNPLLNPSNTLSNGNLDVTAAGNNRVSLATFGIPDSGKWYFEFTDVDSSSGAFITGVGTKDVDRSLYLGYSAIGWGYQTHASNAGYYNNNSFTASGVNVHGNNTVVGIAIDRDSNKLWFSVNGTFVNSGDPASGSNASFTNLPSSGFLFPGASSAIGLKFIFNAGQRTFSSGAPSGFKSLCTANLPDPTIADGSQYFDAKLFAGNGGTQSITGFNFSPDFAWFKRRSAAFSHEFIDIVRGGSKVLFSDLTNAESSNAALVTSFNNDGVSIGSALGANGSGVTSILWAWDAGTSNTTIAAGGLNSSLYDQSQTWSNGTQSGNAPFGSSSWDYVFNGVIPSTFDQSNLVYQIASGGVFTFSSAISGRIQVYSALGSSGYVSGNTIVLSDGSSQEVTNGNSNFVLYDFGTKSNITSITLNGAGNTSGLGVPGILLDGKLLVDAGVSITTPSIASTVRANPSAGFSVVKAPITSSGGTIAHGLNANPGMLILKNIGSNSTNWVVWHSSFGINDYILLNSSAAKANSASLFNGNSTSTFTVGSGFAAGTNDFIAYCFAPVEGYSAFGSYTGNGSADGTFVYTGFRPAFLIIKNASQANSWFIMDTKRNTFNVVDDYLLAESSAAEASSAWIDILSNGFKIRSTATGNNNNGIQNLYIAFAEHPFKTARAR